MHFKNTHALKIFINFIYSVEEISFNLVWQKKNSHFVFVYLFIHGSEIPNLQQFVVRIATYPISERAIDTCLNK
jgi:hypothetical protein